ncbi:hypothetical protein D3C85_691550 [compost metagenome]
MSKTSFNSHALASAVAWHYAKRQHHKVRHWKESGQWHVTVVNLKASSLENLI